MTKDDLVFLGGQFHFSIGPDGKVEQGSFVARVGRQAPATVPDEFKKAIEKDHIASVEIKLSKNSTIFDPYLPELKLTALEEALPQFVPPKPSKKDDGMVLGG